MYKEKEKADPKIERQTRVPALNRSLDIMRFIKKHPRCTTSDIVKALNYPRSSIYVLLEELQNLGFIKLNNKGEVQLWMTLIELGSSAKRNLDLRDIIVPHLNTLLDSIDCIAVHYGIMDGDKGFYAIKLDSPHSSMSIMSHEGLEISLVHAGLGKCLLAFQDEDVKNRIVKNLDYKKATETSIDNPKALREELDVIRVRGWAFDNSEGEESIRCVAAPIFYDDRIIGAISIVGMVHKYTDDVIPYIVEKTMKCAKSIQNSINEKSKI